MTNIEKYIQWGIEGGYPVHHVQQFFNLSGATVKDAEKINEIKEEFLVMQALLDPKFWQAVGKVKGWEGGTKYPMWIESFNAIDKEGVTYEWKNKMHQFIDHLADGKTIDEALGLLE